MPALANITGTDSAAATRTFKPSRVAGGVVTFLDKDTNGGVPAGYAVLTVSHSDTSKTSRNSKTRAKLVVPQLDAEGAVKSTCSVDFTFLCDDKSAELDRNDIVYLGYTLMAAIGSAIVKTNDSYY